MESTTAESPASPALPASPAESLLRLMRAASTPLYALVDAAVDQQIAPLLLDSQRSSRIECLYSGDSATTLAPWAPYLVQLSPEPPLLERLLTQGWGKAWASYFFSTAPFDDLRKHFRKFLMVQVEGQGEAYFRFYDPRVLRDFLPTANASERAEFFGPVTHWLIEAPDGGLVVLANEPAGLLTRAIPKEKLAPTG